MYLFPASLIKQKEHPSVRARVSIRWGLPHLAGRSHGGAREGQSPQRNLPLSLQELSSETKQLPMQPQVPSSRLQAEAVTAAVAAS